jgi:hypothetical protein
MANNLTYGVQKTYNDKHSSLFGRKSNDKQSSLFGPKKLPMTNTLAY